MRQAVVTQLELRRALRDLSEVEQVLPMCAWCRKTKAADGSWRPLHDYVMDAVPVTHGMCPDCATAMTSDV